MLKHFQSEAFGFNHTLSIEYITCEYHNKYYNDVNNEVNLKMDFHSHYQTTPFRIQLPHLNILKKLFNECMRFFNKVWYNI